MGAINNVLSKIFVAGFYYKTFMHPQSFWMKVYEPVIRRAAGLGKAPAEPDPDFYDKMHIHCDVLIAEAGRRPDGRTRRRQNGRPRRPGRRAERIRRFAAGFVKPSTAVPAADWVRDTIEELKRFPEVRLLPRTTVTGYYDHNYLIMAERRTDHLPRGSAPKISRQRLWKVRAKPGRAGDRRA